MSTNPPEPPPFDIFFGESVDEGEFIETVEGLAAAIARMDALALETPGTYFVFNPRTGQILARVKHGGAKGAGGVG